MEPIISPWILYLFDTVIPQIHFLNTIAFFVMIISAVGYGISHTVSEGDTYQLNGILERLQYQLQQVDNDIYDTERERINDLLDKEESYQQWAKHWKYIFIAATIFFGVTLFIPSTQNCYKMLLASYVTPDNIEVGAQITKETLQTILDMIIETVTKIKG